MDKKDIEKAKEVSKAKGLASAAAAIEAINNINNAANANVNEPRDLKPYRVIASKALPKRGYTANEASTAKGGN